MSAGPITYLTPVSKPKDMSREEFEERWNELGQIAVAHPAWEHVRAYSHCPVVDGDALGIRGTLLEGMLPEEYGGVGVFEFENEDELNSFLAHPQLNELSEAHERLLGMPAHDPFVFAEASRLLDRDGTPGVKMFAFLRRRPELSREEFLERWHKFASANFVGNPAVSDTIIAYTQYRGLVGNEAAAAGLDGGMENAFATTDDAITTFSAAAASGIGDRQDFYDPSFGLALLCTEHVVKDTAGERTKRTTAAPASAHGASR
jgi:hypothetical protein